MTATSPPLRTVRILDLDPELGSGLPADAFERAKRYAVAEITEFGVGEHDPADVGRPDLLGMLVLEGMMIRQVLVAERRCGELVGPGALLRPWEHFGGYLSTPFDVRWRVIEPVRIALLDERMIAVAARWPPLMRALISRALERAHMLAFNIAIHCLQHVELRLLILFWNLAEYYGKVTPEGTVLPLKLTHADLAELVGTQRPSVSARLAELQRRREIMRRADRTWLLLGDPPGEIQDIKVRAGVD